VTVESPSCAQGKPRIDKLAGFYRTSNQVNAAPFHAYFSELFRAPLVQCHNNIKREKNNLSRFMLPQKCTVFASASQRQERNNRPAAAALFAANIRDKYRRRFVLANTSQQTKTLFDKAHVRCIMHDIGITSSFVW